MDSSEFKFPVFLPVSLACVSSFLPLFLCTSTVTYFDFDPDDASACALLTTTITGHHAQPSRNNHDALVRQTHTLRQCTHHRPRRRNRGHKNSSMSSCCSLATHQKGRVVYCYVSRICGGLTARG
ncbi:hypothetical protein BGY98DRAFT_976610 [Russula aff. rugulosa BPL654]|nr:hypothetical protein BGY98DRAFT_1015922 [Russula aff. rugulosa BPL654]KAI0277905.1 hypothetical protein BGY98DRAFT_976610 [Russula aff. rugulosa BPL654]